MMEKNCEPSLSREALDEIFLEPARPDMKSVKTQMIAGLVLCLICCLTAYRQALFSGFLLDDFLHFDYVNRACGGDWGDFLKNFTSNWAGSDIMKSYRPVASLSILIDRLIWGSNAFGYHLTNVLLLFAGSAAVGLFTLELTRIYSGRLGAAPAIWAALLFSVYPLHPEAAAWIIGRVDLLSSLFYMGSLAAYLRFRRLREWWLYCASLSMFVLAMASKEMAVSLPLTVALTELLVFRGRPAVSPDLPLKKRLWAAGGFFLAALCFAALRTACLGTVVGGYASAGIPEIWQSLRVFADRATLTKIALPLNEELTPQPAVFTVLAVSYIAVAAILLFRNVARRVSPAPFLFLFLTLIASVLPAFQIWHIHPNLVGSRLAFLASAPLSIIVSLGALPFADCLSKRWAKRAACLGGLLLLSIYVSWSLLLRANLRPWVEAGRRMTRLTGQLQGLAREGDPAKKIVLVNLPTDFQGAGMLTRPQYLDILLKPPLTDGSLSGRFLSVEPPVSGSHEFIWPGRFREAIRQAGRVLIWDSEAGQFKDWLEPGGKPSYAFSAAAADAVSRLTGSTSLAGGDGRRWHALDRTKPTVVSYPGFLRVYPGPAGATIYFPQVAVNPLAAEIARVDLDTAEGGSCNQCLAHNLKLVWSGGDGMPEGKATFRDRYQGSYIFWPGRFRSWTLARQIKRLGIEMAPGQYHVDIRSVAVEPARAWVPLLAVPEAKSSGAAWLYSAPAEGLRLRADASALPAVAWLRLIVTRANLTFDAHGERDVMVANPNAGAGPLLSDETIAGNRGEFTVARSLLSPGAVYQARLIALSPALVPVGLPSEPVSFTASGSGK